MITDVRYPEYRDELAHTLYPFDAAATLTAEDGLAIPRRAVFEASITVAGSPGDAVRITRVDVGAVDAVIVVGTSDDEDMASGAFALADPPAAIPLVGAGGLAAGFLLTDPAALNALAAWPRGAHALGPAAARFVASCVHAAPAVGLQGLVVDGETATGDVWFYGSGGVVLHGGTVASDDRAGLAPWAVVEVNAVGEPLAGRLRCGPDFAPPRIAEGLAVVGRNGHRVRLPPDDRGNIDIVAGDDLAGDTVLRIAVEDGKTIVLAAVGG